MPEIIGIDHIYVAVSDLRRLYPEYASDYMAVFLTDPDGMRLEITNYRDERRYRHAHWHELVS
jgi:transcriptional regulator of acetoin/glycerol metabolism